MKRAGKFAFDRFDRVGYPDATEDRGFLQNCFVDTGDFDVVTKISDPRQIVVGRTGAGKSALLQQLLESQERAISIRPESLALSHVSGSDILSFVSTLGVKLDIFFRLLWRHVFAVEIIRAHFNLRNEDTKKNFLTWVRDRLRNPKHQQAVEYLEKWGRTFWEETDYRVKEVTLTLEHEIAKSVEAARLPITLSLGSVRTITEEQKQEVVTRAQRVVNKVQIQELSGVIDLLDDLLDDPQKQYFIVIDGLDDDWVDEKLRYQLIRALIETLRDFHKVRHAKIVIAVRRDLLDRVFRLTRDGGFQEEKYGGLYLTVRWTPDQLIELIDKRLAFLVRQRYTKARLGFQELMPSAIDHQSPVEWLLDRTLMRPRDLIAFINTAIEIAAGSSRFAAKDLKEAEGEYSRGRLRSIADEWSSDYPNLLAFSPLLKNRPSSFALGDITDDDVIDLCLNLVVEGFESEDFLSTSARQVVDGVIMPASFRRSAAEVFYRVSLVGLKLESHEKVAWSIHGKKSVSSAEINDATRAVVHKSFWRALAVRAV